MKPSKDENKVASTVKATTKYAFVAPGALGKGRGRGLKSLCSLRVSRNDIPFSPSIEQVMQSNQIFETSVVAKGRGRGLRYMFSLGVSKNQVESFHNISPYAGQTISKSTRSDSTMSTAQGMRPMSKNPLVPEKGQVQNNIPSFSSTAEVMQYIQTVNKSAPGKERGPRSVCSFEESKNEEESFLQNAHSISKSSNSTRSNSTMFAAQGLGTTKKNSLVHEKDHMQTDNPFSPSTDKVLQCTQTVETSALGKGRGLRSVCSFEVSENKKGFFHQNVRSQSMSIPSNSTRSNSTMFFAQELRSTNKNTLVHDKEHMQTDIPFSPSTDHVIQSGQTVETSSGTSIKVKRV